MRALVLSLALAMLGTADASAATKTGQVAVRARVVADCRLTTADLDFGDYTANAVSSATSLLTIQCTPGTGVEISFSAGSSGRPRNKTMRSGRNTLDYQIYRDAGHRDPIDDTGTAFVLYRIQNNGQPVTYTLYGEIPSQTAAAGDYADVLQVTASY